ncbi:hypothetical protein PEC18_12215 [Paucibacter sp. O1-1]|nr:hypothetical protein [Paucibacter sp. O1-1]MDA3826581.1 hypothetical protein [Paucibacter sp. O1-1]
MTAAATHIRADQLVLSISTAYSGLCPRTHRQVAEFFRGDHSIPLAHDLAQQLIATTSQDRLALILARLLVMADDEVGALELPAQPLVHPPRTAPQANTVVALQRRRSDTQQGDL